MRIALDATYSVDSQPSGIAIYSRRLLTQLAAHYPDHVFLHCYRLKQFRRSERPAEANVERRLLLPPLPTFRGAVFHALNQRVDRRLARRVVSTFHDLFVMTGEYSTAEFRRRFTDQARGAAQRSDLIITVSEFTAAQVTDLLGVEKSRLRVIPHGVISHGVVSQGLLSQVVDAAPRAADVPREKIVLFVGALQARKNVLRLLEAFESMPEEWKLVLAGAPNGYQAAAILERVETSRARTRIRVTGYAAQTELDNFYGRASIFAFPSLDEGFGMPVLEAMSRGVPVLTSNGSGLREVAGDAALLVDPLSTEDVAAGLNRLACDSTLRDRLVNAGYARAKDFTWDRAAHATFQVYRELTT